MNQTKLTMSYEIIYDKQFIKLSNNKYIPMVLAGSNNCYTVNPINGRERRERNWFPWTLKAGLIGEKDYFLAYWEDVRKEIIERNESKEKDQWYEEYHDNSFGYWTSLSISGKSCSQTTYRNITGVFTNGIKKALTIEQLYSEGVYVIVRTGYISRKQEIKPFYKSVCSEKELLKAIEECNEHTKGSNVETTIDFSGMHENTTKKIRRKFFPSKEKKEKGLITVPYYFTIKIDESGNYLVKRTRRGYQYTYYPYLKFSTHKEAESKVKRYNKKYGQLYSVEKVLEPTKLWV